MKRYFLVGVIWFSGGNAGREVPDFKQGVYDHFVSEISRYKTILENRARDGLSRRDFTRYVKELDSLIVEFQEKCESVHEIAQEIHPRIYQVLHMYSDLLALEKELCDILEIECNSDIRHEIRVLAGKLSIPLNAKDHEELDESDDEFSDSDSDSDSELNGQADDSMEQEEYEYDEYDDVVLRNPIFREWEEIE